MPTESDSITCAKCGKNKAAAEFPKNKARSSGLDAACKVCHKEKNRAQYEKHAANRRRYASEYRSAHTEEKSEYNKAYREENKESLNVYVQKWRETHISNRSSDSVARSRQKQKERYISDTEYRARVKAATAERRKGLDREQLNQKAREWNAKNPDKRRRYAVNWLAKKTPEERVTLGIFTRQKHRVARQTDNARYNARRLAAPGVISNSHLVSLHRWQDHCCFYCRKNMEQKETIEHVVPLSRGGTNHPYNVVLCCASCNASKSDRLYFLEWRPTTIEQTPRVHSLYETGRLRKLLAAGGVEFVDFEDHIQICDRHVFILSSFWLGWAGSGPIKALEKQYPRALFFYDKEFAAHEDAIFNVIKSKAGIAIKTGARKLGVAIPSTAEAQEFIGRWHALGFMSGTQYLGLRDADRWWIIASFRKDVDRYEVVRMACKDTAVGGVSRLVKHFMEEYSEGLPLVAFTDQRIGDGASHFPAGFEAEGLTRRTIFYTSPVERGFYPRRSYQKGALAGRADFYDEALTQNQINITNGMMKLEGLQLLRFVRNP